MKVTPKQELYKTAFSPIYNCFVGIIHAHQDSLGEWIYTCRLENSPADAPVGNGILFRECELERFCL